MQAGDAPLPVPDAPTPPHGVAEFLNSVPELGSAARKTEERAIQSLSVIAEARAHLQSQEVHGRVRDFKVPPTYAEVFQMPVEGQEVQRQWAIQEISYFRTIIDRYKDGNYDVHTIDQDIITLSGNLIFFSAWVNHLDSIATNTETSKKDSEIRTFLELRTWAENQGISVRTFGADTMRALANEETKDRTDLHTWALTVASTIKGFYYALKDFIGYLDRVSERAKVERMGARRTP